MKREDFIEINEKFINVCKEIVESNSCFNYSTPCELCPFDETNLRNKEAKYCYTSIKSANEFLKLFGATKLYINY